MTWVCVGVYLAQKFVFTTRLLLTLMLVDVALTLPLRWLALLICHTKIEHYYSLKIFCPFLIGSISTAKSSLPASVDQIWKTLRYPENDVKSTE